MELQLPLLAIFAYFLGSIPVGKIISNRIAGLDITGIGSRNIGATNVSRVVGIKWGIVTLLLDMCKGLIPILILRSVSNDQAAIFFWTAIVAIASIAGHQFSVFMNFKGGKGVATALGVYIAVSPVAVLVALGIFISVVLLSNFISLGSITAALCLPIVIYLLGKPCPLVIASIAIAAMILARHHSNIDRLLKGKEAKWRNGRSQERNSSNLSSSSSE